MSLQQLRDERPKSFSRYGQRLERQLHPSPVKQTDLRVEVVARMKQLIKPSFETISREVKSPFTLFHGKDHQNLDYKVKYEKVRPHSPIIKISQTQTMFFTDQAASRSLKDFSVDKNQTPPLRQRELQSSRKKFHNMDFDKQSDRKLGPRPERGMQDPQLRYNNFQQESMKRRSHSVHNFRGYTARKDLYESVSNSYRSKEVSNIHEVNMNKLRKRWSSTAGLVPFNKVVDQIKVRSDRDCNPWLTKLTYSPRGADHQSVTRFELLSERKPNQVHSKYPLRICV